MEITRESLMKKREKLEQGRQQLISNIAANEGAIEMVDMLIAELAKKPEAEETSEGKD